MQTKRVVLAQVSVCLGCCCGAVAKGKPAVPVDWMKKEWKERGLKKSIQLTISGCLGPCDLPNVVSISSKEEMVWLGTLCRFQDYAVLVEWASAGGRTGRLLPLPDELTEFRFSPFRGGDSIAISELSQRGSGN
jgi:cobaltochelatase CobN